MKAFAVPEERQLFAKSLDRLFYCLRTGQPSFTDFLDPAKIQKFTAVIRANSSEPAQVDAYGGYEEAERRLLGFFPERTSPSLSGYPIQGLKISHTGKFSALTHRDYLGALLGLGIGRGKVGDILVNREGAVAYLHRDMAGYALSLEQVGRVSVSAALLSPEEDETVSRLPEVADLTVTSLRVDAVLAAGFHLSRQEMTALAAGKRTFVNWSPAEGGKQVKAGDTLTLRGHGRLKILEILGTTSGGRIRVRTEKYGG